MRDPIRAHYRSVPGTGREPGQIAEALALGQTVATWTPIAGQSSAQVDAHRGEIVEISPIPGDDGAWHIAVDYPAGNTELDIASVLVMTFGKPSLDGRLRLLDMEPCARLLDAMPGPRLGVEGIRALVGAGDGRPLTMSIFKPCVGLTPAQLAELFATQCRGGVDLVKDDEILPNLPTAPALGRVRACREVSDRVHAQTGRRTLYVVNLTGPVMELPDRAAGLVAAGAQALLVSVLAYGYGVIEALARDPRVSVPLVAHPALAGALCGPADTGMDHALVLGRIMRWAGADAVLYPAHYGTHGFSPSAALGIRDRLTEPARAMRRALPGPSAGVHPGMVGRLVADYGRDAILNAGGGVYGHPQGPEAGARALREAVEWVEAGRALDGAIPPDRAALREAIATWGVLP